MPYLYVAKVNLNSSIFNAYNNNPCIQGIMEEVYNNIQDDIVYETEENAKYSDSLGNEHKYVKKSQYRLLEIKKKPDSIITGKLYRTYNKRLDKYDERLQKTVTEDVKESFAISFYFDVMNELITFCERQSFGYTQFMDAMAHIIGQCAKPHEFMLYLHKDQDVLSEKISRLKTVNKVKAVLIPPNSNEDDLKALRSLTQFQQCEDANATKMEMDFYSEKMNMDSKVMQEIITAAARGYGDITAIGENQNGKKQTIKSSQEAAYTANIQENINEDDLEKESRNLIVTVLKSLKMRRLLGNKNE